MACNVGNGKLNSNSEVILKQNLKPSNSSAWNAGTIVVFRVLNTVFREGLMKTHFGQSKVAFIQACVLSRFD